MKEKLRSPKDEAPSASLVPVDYIRRLEELLMEATGDGNRIRALTAALKASADRLAAAVEANKLSGQ